MIDTRPTAATDKEIDDFRTMFTHSQPVDWPTRLVHRVIEDRAYIKDLRAEVERLRDLIVTATHTQMQDEIHAILARREKEGK